MSWFLVILMYDWSGHAVTSVVIPGYTSKAECVAVASEMKKEDKVWTTYCIPQTRIKP